ncbi:MAG: hypothetical protein K0R00_180 [Herbinix sp.]|jgi:hypothetical protein|nr:hypothetical protein [Herbinix sp.]
MATSDLSNFYQEFSYGSDKFEFLMDFYEGLFEIMYQNADQIIDNMTVPSVGVYHYIPMQIIPVAEAVYDVSSLLIEKAVVDTYGLANMTLLDRINHWNNVMPITDKVDILDSKKKYIYLTTIREGNPDQRNYEIVDFILQTISGESLIKNVDYAYKDNKIYLVKNLASYYKEGSKLIAKDIAIDYKAPEKIIGNRVFTPYVDTITKNEYRDIVQTLLYIGLGGPTLKNLNETLNTLVGFGQFKVIDYPSARGHYKTFWDETIRGDKALSRFDFLIMAPPDITNDTNVLDMVTNYLKMIKLAYTDFFISPYLDLIERYRVNQLPHSYDHFVKGTHGEKLNATEKRKFFQKLRIANEKIWPGAKYPPEYGESPLVRDVLKHLDDIALKNSKKVKDKITASSKRKSIVSLGVLNASQKFDKININEKAKKSVKTEFSDNRHNIGNLYFYDDGHVCDSNTDVIYFDGIQVDIDDGSYHDNVVVSLIRKSAL